MIFRIILKWQIIYRTIHSFTQTLLEIGYCYRRHGPANNDQSLCYAGPGGRYLSSLTGRVHRLPSPVF